ncbi:guanylyl cyclase [Theileria orientalis strain Shintoku]|uniref:Guanylyl cyclase n=1 Tax=Theileria orientalis strain Shintoku TaxID=869250 RepID=J4CD75_THEOR|nr:guanylyl cyclase [Theileria orientalis strain Shintoku]BAM40652.1 guanylyl cyclase [Theileria orientalis strain Shintoku]|eukprot:XP_009690953.1 guanylyl cyclase [Theileria orientalis strain Shintoku]
MDKSEGKDLSHGRKGTNLGETSSITTNKSGNQQERTGNRDQINVSKGTLNSYKKLPFGTEKELNADSKAAQSRTAGRHGRTNDKLTNSYLGTKIQPAWETRTFNINPVTSDDLSRFLRNEQHTQRWSIISQLFYILFYNVRRFPFLWGIFIFLCEVLVPIWLPRGIPKKAWYSTAVPLFVCLFMSVFLNLLEFKKRYNLGRFIDNKRCILLKDGKLSTVRSGNVVVGNILKLNCDDQIPADAVVLYSSNPDGALYLDTCFLDGQTDLKTKYSVKDSKMESSLRSYHNLKGNIVCDKPCADMNKFSGLLKIKGYPRPSVINIDNFIMRGSILRNTSHIYAVVVYTGPDTKASQNFLRILKPIKIGCLEHTINKISIILGLIYLLCAVSSITVRYINVLRGIGKFNRNVVSSVDSLVFIIYRFVILYAPIIPTTLPAVMDLLRLLYLPFYDSYMSLEAKKNLVKKDRNNNGTWTLNSGLCEELGLVDFIFTDKTGTLTTNNLNITLVTISNKSYTPKQLVQMYRSSSLADSNNLTSTHPIDAVRTGSYKHESEDGDTEINFVREHFMRMLCICNPCLNVHDGDSTNTLSSGFNTTFSRASSFKLNNLQVRSDNRHDDTRDDNDEERSDSRDNDDRYNNKHTRVSDDEEDEDDVDDLPMFKKSKSKAHFGTVSYINLERQNLENDLFEFNEYEAAPELEEKRYLNCISKEDECMVNLANESGYLVVNRTKERIMVNCNGNFVNYDVVGVNEFTSSRKRMSVVVTNLCNDENYLYVKGEGSTMLSCIKDGAVRASVDSRIKKNSLFGYRVIVCGYKSLTSTELLDYQAQVSAHTAALDEKYLNKLEDDIEYLGIIMFRDEIQRDITSAIDLLMDAGIRIWVLTGDNKESTIQTCYLTKLLNVPTRLFNVQFLFDAVNPYDPEGYAQEKSDQAEKRYDAVCDNIYNKFLIEKSNRNSEQMCLVIESRDLDEMMRSAKGQNILVNMACSADVVLGCLLTPVQKGRLVQLVRSKLVPTPITLAIGDGINDIHMMQHSHISICLQPSNDNRFAHMDDGMGLGPEGDSHSATDMARGGTNVSGFEGGDASESTLDKAESAKSRAEQENLLHHNNLIDSHELHRDDCAYKSENYFVRAQKKVISNDVIGYCDFCIDNFSNLTNLLFLQGTRILRAMSLVIYFTLFKSLILMLPLFYYQMFTNWFGLDLYGSFINIVYNLVFTLLPLVFVVLFHQDVNSDLYRRLPILYTLSRRRIYLNMTNSVFWIAEGVIGSLVTYFPLHMLVVSNDNVFKTEIITNRTFGLIVSVASIIIFNTRLLVTYTPNSLLLRALSVGYFFLSVPTYLGLTFVSGKRALGISSFQVIRVVPFYLLVPVWVTFTVVVGILSNMLQMYLLPSLTKYLKAYLNKIRETTMGDLRNVFNLYGNNIVKNMIPTSRPFKIKSVAHMHMNKNKHKDHFRTLINVYTLRFKDIQLENDYKLDKNKKQYYENGHWYKVVFILLLLFYIGGYLIEYFVQKAWLKPPPLYSMVPTLLLSCVLVVCIIVSFNHRLFIRFINQILYSLVIFMILQHVANRFLVKSISWLHPVLFPIFTFVILRLSFVLSVISNVLFFIGTVVAVTDNIHVLPLFIGINIFVGFVGYELEFKSRKNFIMEFSVLNYRKKQSELLNTMLPKTVVSKMINAKLNENGIPVGFEAESHHNVCVIFADVYNFQNLVATTEPHKLVEIMDSLFLSFDRCSKEFDAVKIETVSETYLTSIGLNHRTNSSSIELILTTNTELRCFSETANGLKDSMDELERGKAAASLAIDMAIAMLQVASTMKINNNESIGVKIGINTGYVISGLVGAKKPQYALFGDTVNTASRMKMTGEVGKIHISESTYELLKDDRTLEFTSRQTQVKGKGLMNTYLLEKAIGTNYPNFSSGSTIHEVDIYYNLMKNRGTKGAGTGSLRTLSHSAQSHSSSDEAEDEALLSNERDMERIRNRRININRAVGNEEDEVASFAYEPMYTSNFGASLVESATCFDNPFSRGSNPLSRSQHRLRKGLTMGTFALTYHFSGRRTFSIASARAQKRLMRSNTVSHGSHRSDLRGKYDSGLCNKEVDGIQMKRTETIFLKFRDKLQEDRYRNNFYNSPANVEVNEYALFIFLITFIVQSIININIPRIYHKDGIKLIIFLNYILYWTVRCFFILISFCLWLLFHYRFFSRDDHNKVIKLFTFFLNLLFVMATCVFALSNSWSIKRTEEVDGNLWLTSDSIEFYFYLILLHHSTGMLFQNCLLIDALFLVMSMTFISSSVQSTSTTVTALFTIPICVLFNLLSAHCKESIDRKTFFTNEKAYMIETRINQILNEMLPKSILEEFKQEKLKMSYVHNNMSFLFSDICGFTSWANSVDPSEVIALLQKLFANFDRNTTNFNLYKLCTIGDAYVAISEPYLTNTNDMRLNDLLNILQMAYSMLHIIQETRELFNIPDLNMRIGLHYGSCIGGVIGSGRLRYDVWGTDIYTANMIESNGIPGKVCVSESLKDILSTNFPNRFSFKFHKDVNVIDKVIKSYVIEYDSRENF